MQKPIIGVDLGGTKVLSARIVGDKVEAESRKLICSNAAKQIVIDEVIANIESVFDNDIAGIGVGVPGIVNKDGVLYDIQNIPSWDVLPLAGILKERFNVPVAINNDANCFALGEKFFGKGQGRSDILGLIIGTGVAAGIIINDKLYAGHNCGAGEFGMLPFKDHNFEYYCSGQFFENVHQTTGLEVYEQAAVGDKAALEILEEYGTNLGHCINAILYSIDPEVIIIGGSVSKSFEFFKDAMYDQLKEFAYAPVVDCLTIKVSDNPKISVLGAGALLFDKEVF
ncbi:MAG: ROK family protein [Cyclobacteriaceae bacterium]